MQNNDEYSILLRLRPYYFILANLRQFTCQERLLVLKVLITIINQHNQQQHGKILQNIIDITH